ncbi:MAG: family 16 glycosylhydrolase [Spirochaetales bacterium]|nr:family 16 glycosylhydrolase [Spirochaetales bacterium]
MGRGTSQHYSFQMFALTLLLLALGCTSPTNTIKTPTGVEISPASTTVAIRSTNTLSLLEIFSDGSRVAVTATQWTSANTGIVTVSNGVVTGIATGTALITATYNTFSATETVTVVNNTLSSTGDPWYGGVLKFDDEFNGSTINTANWTYDLGGGGWGNSELETYTTANASIQTVPDGNSNASCLVITAQKDAQGNWTSSRLLTKGLQSFTYGKVEARMKLPYGNGMWPAFWMLGSNLDTVGWPACGETDIMEMIGGSGTSTSSGSPLSDSKVYGTIHWLNYSNKAYPDASYQPEQYTLSTGIFADAFHTFGVIWTASSITYYVDGIQTGSVTPDATTGTTFQQPFFLILNLAVGGTWPGNPTSATISPQTLAVDWVRVYQ